MDPHYKVFIGANTLCAKHSTLKHSVNSSYIQSLGSPRAPSGMVCLILNGVLSFSRLMRWISFTSNSRGRHVLLMFSMRRPLVSCPRVRCGWNPSGDLVDSSFKDGYISLTGKDIHWNIFVFNIKNGKKSYYYTTDTIWKYPSYVIFYFNLTNKTIIFLQR